MSARPSRACSSTPATSSTELSKEREAASTRTAPGCASRRSIFPIHPIIRTSLRPFYAQAGLIGRARCSRSVWLDELHPRAAAAAPHLRVAPAEARGTAERLAEPDGRERCVCGARPGAALAAGYDDPARYPVRDDEQLPRHRRLLVGPRLPAAAGGPRPGAGGARPAAPRARDPDPRRVPALVC